jgi:hypothetical protein
MVYGKYANYGLADQLLFTFNTSEYKLPKGVAFDYDDGGNKPTAQDKVKETRGTIQINYTAYIINKEVPDNVFN